MDNMNLLIMFYIIITFAQVTINPKHLQTRRRTKNASGTKIKLVPENKLIFFTFCGTHVSSRICCLFTQGCDHKVTVHSFTF